MLKYLALFVAVAGMVSAPPPRQVQGPDTHPDLSGRWTVVAPASRPYLGPLGLSRIVTITVTPLGVLTIEYVADEYTATQSITLDDATTENSVVFVTAPGMRGPVQSELVKRSVSRAGWLKGKLRVVTTLTLPWGGKTRTVDVQDVLSLDRDGGLLLETQTSRGGGTMRSHFIRAAAGAIAGASAIDPTPALPRTPAPEREWLDGYRFGMTPDDVRRVPVCPGRNYETVNGGSDHLSLLCRRFPFQDLLVDVHFGFDHNSLNAIGVTAYPSSEKDARLAATVILAYLDVEGGALSSVELGSRTVKPSEIWDDLKRRQTSRFSERLTVTTANRAWPVILMARFSRDPFIVSLNIVHSQ